MWAAFFLPDERASKELDIRMFSAPARRKLAKTILRPTTTHVFLALRLSEIRRKPCPTGCLSIIAVLMQVGLSSCWLQHASAWHIAALATQIREFGGCPGRKSSRKKQSFEANYNASHVCFSKLGSCFHFCWLQKFQRSTSCWDVSSFAAEVKAQKVAGSMLFLGSYKSSQTFKPLWFGT